MIEVQMMPMQAVLDGHAEVLIHSEGNKLSFQNADKHNIISQQLVQNDDFFGSQTLNLLGKSYTFTDKSVNLVLKELNIKPPSMFSPKEQLASEIITALALRNMANQEVKESVASKATAELVSKDTSHEEQAPDVGAG